MRVVNCATFDRGRTIVTDFFSMRTCGLTDAACGSCGRSSLVTATSAHDHHDTVRRSHVPVNTCASSCACSQRLTTDMHAIDATSNLSRANVSLRTSSTRLRSA